MEYEIIMTNKESNRHVIIIKLIRKKINGTQAAKQLKLSIRQTKRLKASIIKNGIKGAIHKLRGKTGNNKLPEKTTKDAIKYLKEKYSDFGPTFAQEKLNEIHKLKIGITTVRKIMIDEKLFKPRPRKKSSEYRAWRERKESCGEMGQFDGSYHKWLEDRGEECCLLANIDDATGKVTLKFDINESTLSVFEFWKEYIKTKGKPIAIYLDKYSTYKINHKSAVDNKEMMTQFQRAMETLGIKVINAHSPQAKGRAERLNETLQDRLVKELRLRNISNIEDANIFLKEYEKIFDSKFGVKAKKEGDLHVPLTKNELEKLDAIFSIHSKRLVRNDYTIQFKNQWIQLAEIQPTGVLKKDIVLIEERLDGTLHIGLRGKYLNYEILPSRPEKVKVLLPMLTTAKSEWKPPANHPWRRHNLRNANTQLIRRNVQV
ncbi:MAG: Integrase core domain protein [Candidatus Moranbacteria bacterium GW2011_GWF1_35_5]|nr:MAG: Integrase core domain protein [Candidatus Moranbacteria bacterium GW2011_GWF1_35_5]